MQTLPTPARATSASAAVSDDEITAAALRILTVRPDDLSDGGDDPTDYTPDPYTELADQLLELAEAVASLAGRGLPEPCFTGLTVQFHGGGESDEQVAAAIDTVGQTLVGAAGEPVEMLDGKTIHHTARGNVGTLHATVFSVLSRKAGGAQ
jgi:hypothetical protein